MTVKIECPTGSGQMLTVFEVAKELGRRLSAIFLRQEGRRPVYGGNAKFQEDPHWRDHLLFYEYFHGDNGAGLGASHQTGWTGLVAAASWLLRQEPDRRGVGRARLVRTAARKGAGSGPGWGEELVAARPA